ncbi:MAG TPA: hypothetical protein VGN72_08315 [Tepidisphaeraceae bacterium]|nr:hypothetical protein [Tepidisphaeraceae bacterium]
MIHRSSIASRVRTAGAIACGWLGRCAVVICLMLAGCGSGKQTSNAGAGSTTGASTGDLQASQPISNTDPCAMRLHDISGGILLYYVTHHTLPETLADLKSSPGMDSLPDTVCPVSGRPFLYTPNGIFIPERNLRIILADPAPSHSRMRWAISIVEPTPNEPLQTKVIALPESFFLLRPPE